MTSTLKIEDVRKLGYNRTRIKNLATSKSEGMKNAISIALNEKFIVGERYSNKAAKDIIQDTYENLAINMNPKATALKEFFEIKKTKIPAGSKRIEGIEIVNVLSVESVKKNNDIFSHFPKTVQEQYTSQQAPPLNLGRADIPCHNFINI